MNASPSAIERAGGAAAAYRHSWRLVALLAAICALSQFNRISMVVAADMRIMQEYDISPTSMGVVYSAFLFAYTVAMIPGGWLIDRRGPRYSLALVCLGSALFVALTGVAGLMVASAGAAMVALVGIRGLMGVVSAPLHPAAANAVSLGVPLRQRSAANGWVIGAALLGISSTYIVFGSLVEITWLDWQGAFLIAALATVCLGLLWIRFAGNAMAHRADHSADRQAPTSALPGTGPWTQLRSLSAAVVWNYVRQNKNLLLLTFSYGAVGYFQYLFFYWMHFYFEDVLKLGSEKSLYYAAIPPLTMAISMPIGGWLSDRIQSLFGWRAARAGLGMVAMSASAGLLLVGTRATDNPVWIVTWLSLALGVLGTVEGAFWVTAVEVGGNRGGLSAGIFNTGGNAGGILAPIATPWVSETLGYGWQAGIGMGSIVCLCGAVAWYWIEPSSRGSCEPTSVVPSLDPSYSAPASSS